MGDSLTKDVEGACNNGLNGILYTQEQSLDAKIDYLKIRSFDDINMDCFD
nr:hypothetical protein [uncultured Dorea sp.]